MNLKCYSWLFIFRFWMGLELILNLIPQNSKLTYVEQKYEFRTSML